MKKRTQHKKISEINNTKEDSYLLITVFTLFSILFLLIVLTKRALWFDEAVYIGMGKFIFSHGKIGLLDALRPPLYPLLLGLLWFFHLNPRVSGILLNWLFDLGSAYLLFKLSSKIMKKKYAILTSAFFLINPIVLSFTSLVLTESFAILLSLLSIYYLTEKKYGLSGFFTALAFLQRFPFGAILIFILLQEVLFSKSRIKAILKTSLTFILTIIPYLIFNQMKFHNVIFPFISAVKTVGEASPNLNYLFYISNVLRTNWLLLFSIIPLLLLPMWAIFPNIKRKLKLRKHEAEIVFFYVLVFIFFLAYFTHTAHKEVRYSLAFLPYLALLSAYGISFLLRNIKLIIGYKKTKILFLLILILIVILGSWGSCSKLKDIIYHPEKTDFSYNQNLNAARNSVVLELKKLNLSNNDVILTNDLFVNYYLNNKVVSLVFPDYTLRILALYNNTKGFIVINECNLKCYSNKCESEKKNILNRLKEYPLLFKSNYFSDNCSYKIYSNQKRG